MNLAMRAAWQRYRHEMANGEIGQELGISPSYVSKLCDVARQSGWIRFIFMGPPETELETRITRLAGLSLGYVRVVATPSWSETPERDEFKPERDNLLGVALAQRIDSVLDDLQRESQATPIPTLAIGSSAAMYSAVQHLGLRSRNVNIVPSALTQVIGRVPRTNAQIIATLLASRLGILPKESTQYHLQDEQEEATDDAPAAKKEDLDTIGKLFMAWVGQAPNEKPAFAQWYLEKLKEIENIHQVWSRTNVIILGVNAVGEFTEIKNGVAVKRERLHRYIDHHRRLKALGVTAGMLSKHGVIGTLAGRYISRSGEQVPLGRILGLNTAEKEIEAIDLVIPAATVRGIAARSVSGGPRSGHSILVFGGKEEGAIAASAVKGGWANSIMCDREGALEFIRQWPNLFSALPYTGGSLDSEALDKALGQTSGMDPVTR
jgi:hypothetical protein